MTSNERSEQASIAALTRSARTPGAEISAAGRAAFLKKFADGHECALCPRTDIPADLAPAERTRRADILLRAHMQRIARQSRRNRALARKYLGDAQRAEAQLAAELADVASAF